MAMAIINLVLPQTPVPCLDVNLPRHAKTCRKDEVIQKQL